jgi:hypothetical protein
VGFFLEWWAHWAPMVNTVLLVLVLGGLVAVTRALGK